MRIYRDVSSLSARERQKLIKALKGSATWDTAQFDPITGLPVSENPPPDVFFGMEYRDPFLESVGAVCSSAVWQLQNRGGYNDSARLNRERIARDAVAWELERKAMRPKPKSRKRAA